MTTVWRVNSDPPQGSDARPVEPTSPTERRHPDTWNIDTLTTIDALRLMHGDYSRVLAAVDAALPDLACVVDEAVTRLSTGGKLHYFGAGTSGRLAVMDAAEVPPTFGVSAELVVAHIAGGAAALTKAVEGAEDDEHAAEADAAAVTEHDIVVGVTASGMTPYALAAVMAAGRRGAYTALVTASPVVSPGVQVHRRVVVDTGPEAVTGSTRLKAATAQKMVLNALTTTTMIQLGRTYSNLMIDLAPANAKLRNRLAWLLTEASGVPRPRCERVLAACEGRADVALVVLCGDVTTSAAAAAVKAGGSVRRALALLHGRVEASGTALGS